MVVIRIQLKMIILHFDTLNECSLVELWFVFVRFVVCAAQTCRSYQIDRSKIVHESLKQWIEHIIAIVDIVIMWACMYHTIQCEQNDIIWRSMWLWPMSNVRCNAMQCNTMFIIYLLNSCIYFTTKTYVDLQVEAYSHVHVWNHLLHVHIFI